MQWFKDYITSPTHQWWVNNVWRPSWTKFLSLVYGIPALLLTVFQTLASWGNDTTIAQYIDRMNMPNWVPVAFAGIAMLSYIAHGRSEN